VFILRNMRWEEHVACTYNIKEIDFVGKSEGMGARGRPRQMGHGILTAWT
jgi:hypothetical protein